MTIGQIIKELRIKKGITQDELATLVGYKGRSAVNKIELDERDIPRSMIVKFAQVLGTTPNVLMGWDENEPPASDYSDLYAKYPNIKPIKKVKIPMLGTISCGEPTFADEEHETYIETDGHIQADFCLTCSGDSMEPKLLDGDIVFIREQPEVDDGQIAAVIIEDEATLKRVYYDKANNILRLIAENPKYDPFIYSGEQLDHIRILGRAVSLYRKIR